MVCTTGKTLLALSAFVLLFSACPAPVKADSTAYVVTSSPGQFGSMDLGTGALTPVRSGDFNGIALTSNGYVVEDVNNNLLHLEPHTGQLTTIGNTGVTFTTFGGTGDGRLYGVDYKNDLYKISATTGQATRIGATGLPDISNGLFGNSLAGNANTLYYTLGTRDSQGNDVLASKLYTLDMTTGAATAVGLNGLPAGRTFTGAGFIDNTLYAFTDGVYTVNTTTGAATFVSNTPYVVYGAVRVVPAPGALLTALLGALPGASLLLRRRRK